MYRLDCAESGAQEIGFIYTSLLAVLLERQCDSVDEPPVATPVIEPQAVPELTSYCGRWLY